MSDSIAAGAGYLLIVVLCAWAVWHCAVQLWSNMKSGTAADRTLSEVHKDEDPGLFRTQAFGYVALIGAAGLIGLFFLAMLAQALLGRR